MSECACESRLLDIKGVINYGFEALIVCVCVSADCQISFGQAINNEALYVCFVLCVKVCVCVSEDF